MFKTVHINMRISLIVGLLSSSAGHAQISVDDCQSILVSEQKIEAAQLSPKNGLVQSFIDDNPYLDTLEKSQAEFLISLGAIVEQQSVTFKNPYRLPTLINARVEQMVSQGVIASHEALYWADTYLNIQTGQLVFVKAQSEQPHGSIPFASGAFKMIGKNERGLIYQLDPESQLNSAAQRVFSTPVLSDTDFNRAASEGFFAGFIDPTVVQIDLRTNQLGYPQAILLHDLAHYGGFFEAPELMAAFRNGAKALLNLPQDTSFAAISKAFTDFNEGLLLVDLDAVHGLKEASKISMSHLFLMETTEIEQLSRFLINGYEQARRPLGGSIRTPGWRHRLAFEIDRSFDQLSRTLNSDVDSNDRRDKLIQDLYYFIIRLRIQSVMTVKNSMPAELLQTQLPSQSTIGR